MTVVPDVTQNLKDAGCDDEFIQQYLCLQSHGRTNEQLRVLACHRCKLIEEVHANKKKVDNLDFLIYTIKKQQI